jgi:hypothetical protein
MSPVGMMRSCAFGRDRYESWAELPAPGTVPLRRPSSQAIVILIIVIISVLWLLAAGYGADAALEVMGAIGLIAGNITAVLAGTQSSPQL